MWWHVHNVFWTIFTFNRRLFCMSIFFFCRDEFWAPTSSMTFSCIYLSIWRKSKKVTWPAIGLCARKMLRIAVGGIFEHKPLFNWRYPVGPHIYDCSPLLGEAESTKTGEKRTGNNTAGELRVLENSLGFFYLGPQGSLRRPARPQLSFHKLFVFLLS